VRDATGIVRPEASHDLPASPDNAYISIVAAENQIFGACTDARYLIAFEEGARLIVGESDCGDLEEVEGLPLQSVQRLVPLVK